VTEQEKAAAIESVARALATAAGHDPEAQVLAFQTSPLVIGGWLTVPVGEAQPIWELYAGQATTAVEALP
jgi:hypothetical protein